MCKKMIYLTCFVSILLLIGNAPAATITWDAGGDGISWDDGDNWSGDTKPTSSDDVRLEANDNPLIDSTMTETCNIIYISLNTGTAELDITGGSLGTTGAAPYILIGYSSTGIVNISGGTLSGADQVFCGMYATGTVNQTGGTVSSGEKTVIGRDAVGTGTWNMSDGTLSVAAHMMVGESGDGTLNMDGGTITITQGLYIAQFSGSSGTVNLDGGTINAAGLYMYAGRSSMDVSGGTLILDGDDTTTVQGYIDNSYITAYDGNGTFNLDYNVTNAGKTTLTATRTTAAWDGGGDGESWDDGDNWSYDTKPGATETALLDSGDEALVDSTMTETCNQIHVGYASGSAVLDVTGGSLSTTGTTPYISIAIGGSSSGTMNISGGTLSGGNQVFCGFGGTGTVNMTGGTVSSGEKTVVGRNAGGTGIWNMSSGTLSVAVHMMVGESGDGTLNMDGGTITITQDLYIAQFSGSSGTINLDGGTINAADLYMYAGRSSMDVSGGTLILGGDDTTTVQGYINSGYITAYAGNGTFNLDYNVTNAGKTTLTATLTNPYGTAYNGPHNMPGTIQAEDFNAGGSKYAYYCQTSGNQGNNTTYRTGVDVDIYTDAGDPNIVYVQWSSGQGFVKEFLNYTFAVSSAGWYDVVYRARGTGGAGNSGMVKTLLDDRALGYSQWFDPNEWSDSNAVNTVYMSADTHVLKIVAHGEKVRLDYISISSTSAPNGVAPFLVDTGSDLIVADINVLASPFSADNTGVNDCTSAIQDALNTMGDLAGGTVYMPAGQYKIDGTLLMPYNVTLVGDWKKPADLTDINDITLLKATYGGLEYSDPNFNSNDFIRLGFDACVRNLSIWYPHQVASDPCQYPYSIASNSQYDHACTIQNITLYNSYKGIDRHVSASKINDIYGTCLQQGILTRMSWEFSLLYNIDIGNSYWKNADANVITNAPTSDSDIDALDLYTTTNLDGVILGHNDGTAVYNITVNDARRGVLIGKQEGDDTGFAHALSKIDTDIYEVNNTFGAYADIFYVKIDNITEASSKSYTFASYTRPSGSLYVVTDSPYNAVGDGLTDDTNSIQDALTAAGNAGGGTVYLPQGQYRVNTHLTVPQGVELRGASGARSVGWTRDICTLLAYEGKGTADPNGATAFITLNQDSGIRGVRITYPEQGYGSEAKPVSAYPYTIRGNGSGVWVADIHLSNSYNGIDLATNRCDNHFVGDIWATCYSTGLLVGGGSQNGKVERHIHNLRFEGAFIQNSPYYYDAGTVEQYFHDNTVVYEMGNCSGQKSFAMNSYKPYKLLVTNNSNCDNAEFWHCISDNAKKYAFEIQDGNNIDLIGCEAGSAYHDNWLITQSGFSGTVNVYGKKVWLSQQDTHHANNGGTINHYYEETLVTNKTVTASGSVGGNNPERAVDKSLATKWADITAGTKWLKVDLGQPCEIDRWHLLNCNENLEGAIYNTADADIDYSMDDSTYTKADGFTDNSYDFKDRVFDSKRARYVKLKVIDGTQPGSDGYARIPEFMVYGREGWQFFDSSHGWTEGDDIGDFVTSDRKLELEITGTDPYITSATDLNIDTSVYDSVMVKMDNATSSTTGELRFITNSDTSWNAAKSDTVTLTADENLYSEYTFDFSDCNDWTGTLKQIRLYPVDATGDVSIDYIRLE